MPAARPTAALSGTASPGSASPGVASPGSAPQGLSDRLTGWSHEPRMVGGHLLLGRSVLFEVLSVSPAGSPQEHGMIGAAVRDGFGLEQRLQLPAALGLRSGSLLRIDRVNAQSVAATNLSDSGRPVPLTDAAQWFPAARLGALAALACALGAAILLRFSGMAGLAAGLALIAPACCTLLRSIRAGRCRAQLRDYMNAVCAHRADPLPASAPRPRGRASVPLVARRGEALA